MKNEIIVCTVPKLVTIKIGTYYNFVVIYLYISVCYLLLEGNTISDKYCNTNIVKLIALLCEKFYVHLFNFLLYFD